jgi:hypothetical protein
MLVPSEDNNIDMDRLIKAHLNEGMVSALTDAAPTLLLLFIFKIFLLGGWDRKQR